MTPHEQELLLWAQRLCAQQELSLFGMQQRLTKRGATNAECDTILAALEAEGFIDELRFATAFVHDKFCFEKWGRMKIAYKLSTNHHIDQTVISKALMQLDAEEELQLLEELLRSKLKIGEPLTEPLKMKLLRFSEQRGFSKAQFFTALRRIKDNTDE